jgi:hypothetical protein
MIDGILNILLRIGELAFAAVVAGLTGEYLHAVGKSDSEAKRRMIYTEVIAGVSILLSLLWLLPFAGSFIHWPVDLLLFVAWIIAFGLMVDVSYFLIVYSLYLRRDGYLLLAISCA